jgi:hypothetical protein
MQSRGITLSFHREMADSSCELVGPDVSAAVSFESYPRFIKGRFQDCEGLGIERSTADSKRVSSVRSRFPGNNLFWSLLQKVAEFLELPGAWVSCPTLTHSPTLHSVPCLATKETRTRRASDPPVPRPDERPTQQCGTRPTGRGDL